MAVKQDPRNGVYYDWVLGDNNWHTNMNANLRKLGLLLYLSAISRSVSTPPGSPAAGDTYIVGPSATGAWLGHDDDVTVWVAAEGAWAFYAPRTGYLCDVVDEGFLAKWDGAAWVQAGNAPDTLDFREDVVINGRFDLWQEGTSQTSSGYGSDDLWLNLHSGSTKTHSRQAFAFGQTDVPGNPKYFSRTAVTSAAGASNYAAKHRRFEDVTRFSGKTVNFAVWAKADAARDVAVSCAQNFGTGGSPSADVNSIGVTTLSLTTSWQRFIVPVTFPSVSGKTPGTNGDDFSALVIWFDAGSDFDASTNSLGQQSGTFDLANVRGVIGSFPLGDEHWRDVDEELRKVGRFWEKSYQLEDPPQSNTAVSEAILMARASAADSTVQGNVNFMTRKRATPTITTYRRDGSATDPSYWRYNTSVYAAVTVQNEAETGFGVRFDGTGSGFTVGEAILLDGHWVADARL